MNHNATCKGIDRIQPYMLSSVHRISMIINFETIKCCHDSWPASWSNPFKHINFNYLSSLIWQDCDHHHPICGFYGPWLCLCWVSRIVLELTCLTVLHCFHSTADCCCWFIGWTSKSCVRCTLLFANACDLLVSHWWKQLLNGNNVGLLKELIPTQSNSANTYSINTHNIQNWVLNVLGKLLLHRFFP